MDGSRSTILKMDTLGFEWECLMGLLFTPPEAWSLQMLKHLNDCTLEKSLPHELVI